MYFRTYDRFDFYSFHPAGRKVFCLLPKKNKKKIRGVKETERMMKE